MITAQTLSNNTLTIVVDNGQVLFSTKDQPYWAEKLDAYNRRDEAKLIELMSMKRIVEKFSKGGLVVADNGVFFRDMPLGGIDVDRVMAYMRQNIPYESIGNYMLRKMANPSRRAIREMYNFLEHRQMPLTPDGCIIAFKGVQSDYYSVTGGKEPLISGRRNDMDQIYNGIGEIIEMDRNLVDDDFRVGCSGGLHAGSLDYAKNWARDHKGIIILVEIDPANVVSVPIDCDCKKLRCNKYKVIGRYTGPLPDTYTAEYTSPITNIETNDGDGDADLSDHCPECGFTDCVCEDEECESCGCTPDRCTCDRQEEPTNANGVEVAVVSTGDPLDKLALNTLKEISNPSPHVREMIVKLEASMAKIPTPPPTLPSEVEAALKAPPVPVDAPFIIPRKPSPNAADLAYFDPPAVLRRKFVEIIGDQFGLARVDMITDADIFTTDLGADSLDLVELVMAFELEFGIEISDNVAERITTVGEAIKVLTELITKRDAPPMTPAPVPTVNDPWLEKKIKIEDECIVTAGDMAPSEQLLNEKYQEGYQIGSRNGTRRVKRLHRTGDDANAKDPLDAAFIRGYNDGYLSARWDYVKKS